MVTRAARNDRAPAERMPVARVCVDVPLAHLDRPFDYLVEAADDEIARPGVRVKVRFAGQLVGGFLLERVESSPHTGRLAYIEKIVSPEQVLDPEIARLARAMADRYAGNLCDVLRLAVPPRHARVEAQASPTTTAVRGDAGGEAAAAAEELAADQEPAIKATLGTGESAGAEATLAARERPKAAATPTVRESAAVSPAFAADESAAVSPAFAADESAAVSPAFAAHESAAVSPAIAAHESAAVRPTFAAGESAAVGPTFAAAEGPAVEAALAATEGPAVEAALAAAEGPAVETTPAAAERPEVQATLAAGEKAAVGVTLRADETAAVAGGLASDETFAVDETVLPDETAGSGEKGSAGEAAAAGETGAPHEKVAGQETDAAGEAVATTRGAAATASVGSGGVREVEAGEGWGAYAAGAAFLRGLSDGRPLRAVWGALPGEDWARRIAEAAAATVRAGLGAVIVVADARDLERMDWALGDVLGDGQHVALNAALGPAERYRRFLAASRHRVPVVVGTRAAMWAPVAKLGLVVIWDDGDDLHAEPRSPYPHAREVLLTRAQLSGCAALVAGFARTGEAQLLLETGWAKEIVAPRDMVRRRSPAIAPTGDDPQLARDPGAATARLPSLAWQAARQALQGDTPVLVQVPRRGYLPNTACAECRTPARCPHCSGPLGLTGARDVPTCHWCGRASAAYSCPACGSRRLRASVTGARRTAEELGRAFPGAAVRTSGRDEILDHVPAEAAVVVATPGAEPTAEGGYGAVLLLDTWALLTRADLRAAEETMRRWLNAAALARPAPHGRVIVVADGALAPVQALLRWDPGWFAGRELAERRELGFPPAVRMASVTGKAEAVAELLSAAKLPEGAELLGPVPAEEDQERMLVRVTRGRAAEMARSLHEASAVRSARKAALPVRIEVDPAALF